MKSCVVVANWKMNKTPDQVEEFCRKFHSQVPQRPANVTTIICPTFLSITTVAGCMRGVDWGMGAQDGHWHPEGAYTGDVSMAMLRRVGVTHVLIGHSERRIQHNEDDAAVQRKVTAARSVGLVPILCVGERIEERLAGKAGEVVSQQIERALATVPADQLTGVLLAYEPVWSIGTGQAASPHDARTMVGVIRSVLQRWGEGARADQVCILYGGSVTEGNVKQYLAAGMNGVLVGKASLDPVLLHRLVLSAGEGA
ncbi:triose-phosphate isomerase [Pasteuria penetrans]|uniref:triose-phosphate isomerase n=1 Tax=Pasteuria penetrans TaxID=86005 RepID=UPI000F947A59|nr:triose-phosphate isomerase [Pasteuria penetrans]